MPRYDSESEADGRYVVAFVESAGEVSPVFERKVRQIFEKHLPTLDVEKWYRTDNVVAAFREVNEEIGSATMQQGGVEAAKAIPWPEHVSSVGGALETIIQMHREAYRNSQQRNPGGNYTVRDVSDRSARVGILNGFPYGAGFAKGVFKQVVRDLGPSDASPRLEDVEPDDEESHAWRLSW